MSIGNTKDQGNKGNNFPYQLRNLQLLSVIAGNTTGLVPPGGLATEATQLSVLAALSTQQEFVSSLVIDTGNPVGCEVLGTCPMYTRLMTYDESTGLWTTTYYDAAGIPILPIGPLKFVNPQFTLENIYTSIASIDNKTPLLGQALAANSVPVVLTAIQISALTPPAAIVGFALEAGNLATIAGTVSAGFVKVSDGGGSLTIDGAVSVSNMIPAVETGLAKDATLTGGTQQTKLTDGANVVGVTGNALDVNLKTTVTTSRAMTFVRKTDATGSPIAAGKKSISVYNAGAAAGSILGVAGNILSGEQVSFTAGEDGFLAAFAYDATGTTLVITTVE